MTGTDLTKVLSITELRARAARHDLAIRISTLARIYPQTHAALVGALVLTNTEELAATVGTIESLIARELAGADPLPPNQLATAVAAIKAKRSQQPEETPTMTTPKVRAELIPVADDNPYPLGRAGIHHDPRNRDFRALVDPPTRTTKPGRAWPSADVYNQGSESSCTAQAAVGCLRTFPFRASFKPDWPTYDEPAERHELYREAQKHDPWAGESYEGSSTDAPFRVLRDRGQIAEWRWLFGEEELRDYVTWCGPACVGTVWYRSMFEPLPDGVLVVNPESGVAGGHAYRIVQAHKARKCYRIVNSWGREWGQGGRAWVPFAKMAELLAADGEAVTIKAAS